MPPGIQDSELDELALEIIEEESWAQEFDSDDPRHRQLVVRIRDLMDEPDQMFLVKKRIIHKSTRRGTTALWTVIGRHLAWPTVGELGDWYSRTDLFTLFSQYEAFGLVFFEAMAHGAPVLTHDVGANRELLTRGAVVGPRFDKQA